MLTAEPAIAEPAIAVPSSSRGGPSATDLARRHRELVAEQARSQATPRRRAGVVARSLFVTMDVLYGRARSLEKFLVLELVARVPYQTWEHAAYLSITRHARETRRAREIYRRVLSARDQQDNEQWHLFILEDMLEHRAAAHAGRRPGRWRYRVLPQVIALVYYHVSWFMFVLRPEWSYRLNADFEDHAEHEYMAFVAEHPELEREACACSVADDYGAFASLADVLRQVGVDERNHKQESLDELARLAAERAVDRQAASARRRARRRAHRDRDRRHASDQRHSCHVE